MHTIKQKSNRFSVLWVIQPQPSRTEVDCGVFMVYERADPLKWTARSPIGHAFVNILRFASSMYLEVHIHTTGKA